MEVYFLKKLILHRSDILGRNKSQNIEGCSEQNCRKSLLIPPLHLPAHFFETPAQFRPRAHFCCVFGAWTLARQLEDPSGQPNSLKAQQICLVCTMPRVDLPVSSLARQVCVALFLLKPCTAYAMHTSLADLIAIIGPLLAFLETLELEGQRWQHCVARSCIQ